MNKYEKLIEYIINEQEDKARELFHQIVVDKSREIYENLIDEEDVEESVMDPVNDLVDEVEAEEEGVIEAEDEEGMDDMGGDMDVEVALLDRRADLARQHQVAAVARRDQHALAAVESGLAADGEEALDLLVDAADRQHLAERADRAGDGYALLQRQAS